MMDSEAVTQDFDEAFATLYPRARRVALRILESVPDAEDAAAEALARALVRWKGIGQLAHRRLTTDDGVTAAEVADFVVSLIVNGLRPGNS